MKLNRALALVVMAFLGTAVFAWSHAHRKARKAVASASHALVQNLDAGLILAGKIVPMITKPIIGRNLNLAVPLNTWVKQGDTIGTVESQTAAGEMDGARQELEEAISAERKAEERIRQAQEELGTLPAQVNTMRVQEALAETAEFDAEQEFERREDAARSGFTPSIDYDTAVTAQDSAEAAVISLRSNLAEAAIEIDEWKARAQEAQAELGEATKRRNAAEAVLAQMQGGSENEPIVSPADGIIVDSGDPAGTGFGIASDPRKLCAYAMVRRADLMMLRVGQEALIVLDSRPAVAFHAKVSAISETPVDSSKNGSYQVTFVVDNPGGTWLSGGSVHVRLARSSR